MIKIVIDDEPQLVQDFKDRFDPLVRGRINFYRMFFKLMQNNIGFDAFIKIPAMHRYRTTLINAIDENIKIKRQELISTDTTIRKLFSPAISEQIIKYLDKLELSVTDILTGRAGILIPLRNKLKPPTAIKIWVDNICKMIFDYDLFYKEEDSEWGFGAELANRLNINVCPYCNRNYITTVIDLKTNEKIIGPTYDHFFSQEKYPLFRISLYNLIPSCTVCNSNLKHTKEFNLEHFLYPYDDEMGDDIWFDFRIKDFDPKNIGTGKNYQINLAPKIIRDATKKLKIWGTGKGDPLKGSFNIFRLEEIYEKAHGDVVEDIELKCEKESFRYAGSVIKLLGKNGNLEEFYRFYFGSYINKKDWNKRPLAKLTYDIVSRRLKEYKIDLKSLTSK